jgi:phosphohistidine phosphatase SixA
MKQIPCIVLLVAAAFASPAADAQRAGGAESRPVLLTSLRQGGLVIVMRHASSPAAVPARSAANADNPAGERQLDAAGRDAATRMGQALRALKIPLGEVLTSPTYRARETARLAEWEGAVPVDELGDGGQSMQGVPEAQAAWLRERVARVPARGNTLLITHMPNIARAFPGWAAVADGEAVVLRPDGRGGVTILGRIRIEEWPALP